MTVLATTAQAMGPEDRNRALVSQASSRGIVLKKKTKSVYKSTGAGSASVSTWTGERLTGFSVEVTPAVNRMDALTATMENLRLSLCGPSLRQVEGWMAELDVITAKRAEDSMTINLRIRAYGKRLMTYPADIVHEALIVRTWHFWPTWDALAEAMEPETFARRKMVEAVESAIDHKQAEPEAKRERISGDRAQQIRDAWRPMGQVTPRTFGGEGQ